MKIRNYIIIGMSILLIINQLTVTVSDTFIAKSTPSVL